MTTRFDDALVAATDLALPVRDLGVDVVLLRDIVGRIRLILDDGESTLNEHALSEVSAALVAALGPFAAPTGVILKASSLLDPESVLASGDLIPIEPRGSSRGGLSILERTVVGSEWLRVREDPEQNRVSVYSFKGGVGRSTATAMLAHELARRGLVVLVIDLDLESPGISAILQPPDELPDYGLIDLLVESAVGNSSGLVPITRSTVLRPPGNGEVWLAPAGGRQRSGYSYIEKLNRVYTDVPPHTIDEAPVSFGQRLDEAVSPDFSLLIG